MGSERRGTMAQETILVVDDEAYTVEPAQMYLEQAGYRVASAGDGQEALILARRQRPALVVLDLMLPGLDGWEVCRCLRAESDVPVIMLTTRGEDVDRIVGLEWSGPGFGHRPRDCPGPQWADLGRKCGRSGDALYGRTAGIR